ncbi:MAG: FAD-binding and (Fe-S)-binding domain-containing protein [Longimicrobiales bacterium]
MQRSGASKQPSRELEDALRRAVDGEVRFDDGSLALYATDASNFRQTPIGVVVPRDTADAAAAMDVCRVFDAPVLGRGGATSLAGQCCNHAVVLDFAKYVNRVLDIDVERQVARVEPGVVHDALRRRAKEHGLTFWPDPATHGWCTIGGMIGNNSCGVHSIVAGKTQENVETLRVLLYDGTEMQVGATAESELQRIVAAGGRRGEIYAALRGLRDAHADLVRERYPSIPRRVSGYNLEELLPERGFHVARALVGTESTCALVLEAEVKLRPDPAARVLLVLGYEDVYAAADHVPEVLAQEPIGLDGMDHRLIEYMRRKGLHVSDLELLPDGRGWLLVELAGSTPAAAASAAERAARELTNGNGGAIDARLISDAGDAARIWTIRESGLGATAFVPGMKSTWEGWEDAAVPPARLGAYLREFRALLDDYGYDGAFYGHFGDGCVHTRTDFDLETSSGIERYRAFLDDAATLVVRYGGSLSGEHGDGQARAALLPLMFGSDLVDVFRRFKRIFDPAGRMNPGKVVDAYDPAENLRLGTSHRPARVQTHFQYPGDGGDFARATLRCVGVGQCRRTETGTMCPSYQVTREEKHSTRGRAHLLFEMMRGEVIQDGWRSEAVKEALDLCLSCKGCKGECPVSVDVATYKAEFLSHYYASRLRPRAAYTMGLIYWWARLAAHAPGLINAVMHAPGLSQLLKRSAGIATQRSMPRFARRTFRSLYAEQRRREQPRQSLEQRERVVLWADTFTNHFEPDIGMAAAELLEACGCDVVVPEASLCCGRPLYDWGMLDLARRQLERVLETLRDELELGTPIVVLEPSCASVFRDELPNLLAHERDAKRLAAQTKTLGEFLGARRGRLDLRPLEQEVLFHGHCHHKSVIGMQPDRELLRALAPRLREPDTGCCGMAGAFGFEAEKYEVAQACGERVLLPAVRELGSDALIVTDGFSCRQQIAQSTGRSALHLSQILRSAVERQTEARYPAAASGRQGARESSS